MYHLHLIKRRHLDERKTLTKVSTCRPLTNIPQNKSAHLGTRKPGKTYANSKTTGKRSRHGRNQRKEPCIASQLESLTSHTSPAHEAEVAEASPDPEEVDREEIEVIIGLGVRIGSEEEKEDFPKEVDFRVKSLIKALQLKDLEYLEKR